MTRLDELRLKVESLYDEKLAGRADWADWMFDNHIVIVANNAKRIAKRKNANVELSQVAALLHDVADYKMKRENPKHEAESLKLARQLMKDYGYNDREISIVVDDAIRFHSCHGKVRPKSKEGLVLATADALAHFQSDLYVFATWAMGKKQSLEAVKAWTLNKIDRDMNNKISFDDIREEVRPDYDLIKELWSREIICAQLNMQEFVIINA